jgi:hypothetical protein
MPETVVKSRFQKGCFASAARAASCQRRFALAAAVPTGVASAVETAVLSSPEFIAEPP